MTATSWALFGLRSESFTCLWAQFRLEEVSLGGTKRVLIKMVRSNTVCNQGGGHGNEVVVLDLELDVFGDTSGEKEIGRQNNKKWKQKRPKNIILKCETT
eukprot:c11763_g1_i3.p1 GENE.c11763_g1_i3~~c11763_g1_i3.p1  ORF type:complete len:100 (-),score=17.56 c11763_g1_i3:122-421(-)